MAPETSLWSVIAIAQAAVAGGFDQHLDRGRAVTRMVGVHVEVDFDQRPVAQLLPQFFVAGRIMAVGDQPLVDRLESPSHPDQLSTSNLPHCAGSLHAAESSPQLDLAGQGDRPRPGRAGRAGRPRPVRHSGRSWS